MIAANARRYPVSAQCEILGVARATYYYMVKREDAEPKLDPLEDEVVSIFHENRGRYGARRIRAVLARSPVQPRDRGPRRKREEGCLIAIPRLSRQWGQERIKQLEENRKTATWAKKKKPLIDPLMADEAMRFLEAVLRMPLMSDGPRPHAYNTWRKHCVKFIDENGFAGIRPYSL